MSGGGGLRPPYDAPSVGWAKPTIVGLRVRTVLLEPRLALETASGKFARWPVLLLDLQTDAGITGHAFVGLFMPMMLKPMRALLEGLSEIVAGEALCPQALERKLRAAAKLVGVQGPLATAVALIEIAAWDALGKAAGLPVANLLGAPRTAHPVYQTLVTMAPGKAAELAQQAVADGYGGVKLKLGHADPRNDIQLVAAVRRAVGDDIAVMGDYNQSLTVPAALERIRTIDDEGLAWIEEPTSARDYAGHARIAQAVRTPIQFGENWLSLADAADSLRAGASHYVMPDIVKIGGVTAFLKAATLAEAHAVPLSAHSFPEFCAHLLPACATAHWLEHVGMADDIMLSPPKPAQGKLAAPAAPGFGLDWNEDAIARFEIT